MHKSITILGSTGTIGVSTLKIVDQYAERFSVTAMSAGRNTELFSEQIKRFQPKLVAVKDQQTARELKQKLDGIKVEIVYGQEGICEVAQHPDASVVVSGIVGFAAVAPTLAAIEAGKDIALANKEAIIAAGPVILEPAKRMGVKLLPVDSEHSAIFQALHGSDPAEIARLRRIVLTASGGPFLHTPKEDLKKVTVKAALNHPTWKMGAKITIDSSTMMNKGLEVIEATRLFDLPATKVGVQVHPESIIHSMIEYVDGSFLAQLGITDMRGPISYAMAYPDRLDGVLPSLNLSEIGKLTFFDADLEKFPCLRLAYDAAAEGGSMPVVLNGANEVCVDAFLNEKLGYTDIPYFVEKVMDAHQPEELSSLEQVCAIDAKTRELTLAEITKRG